MCLLLYSFDYLKFFSISDIVSDFLLFAMYLQAETEYNPWFARLTLLFIYLPSLNVLATLYGCIRQKDGGNNVEVESRICSNSTAHVRSRMTASSPS